MPPSSSNGGSSRRKQGQPTVCLDCYLRKVKCDRKRPCSTCVRRGTEHLCKTFATSELDPEALKKKQARRSLSELVPTETSTSSEASGPSSTPSVSDPPLTSFINHLLSDLSLDASPSPSASPSIPPVSRYLDAPVLEAVLRFTALVPSWPLLQRILNIYLREVDWKFMITAQDHLEAAVHDLFRRLVVPLQAYEHTSALPLFSPGDLSRMALLAAIMCETLECIPPALFAELLPASPRRVAGLTALVGHVQALIEHCSRLEELTIELVQSNLTAFSIWMSQGLFGTSAFPKWELSVRAAREAGLFEDPERAGTYDTHELDHRRRLAWLVYGYDHSYATGGNMKPLIAESQFSVDRPSPLPPWTKSGAPPDPALAMCEVDVAKIAALLSSTLCYGPPLHRKVMEVDAEILALVARLPPSYALDTPDTSMDAQDPWRARRRAWLAINLTWQRSVLHRTFFPNGKIDNGELATSRHIAIDSTLRALAKVRELKSAANRYADWQGSAWYYQYMTEPSITLATATLLLIRSKGRGLPGLAHEAACWPTVFHFTKVLDQSILDIDTSMQDTPNALPSFLGFGNRCRLMILQLRTAIQSGIDAIVTADPGMETKLVPDDGLARLLNPRAMGDTQPFKLRREYSDATVQRREDRGLGEWIASVQMGVMLPP